MSTSTGHLFRNFSLEADTLFKSIDTSGNNAISDEEATIYFETTSKYRQSSIFSLKKELDKMDINNDGVISPNEFDDSLKN